MYIFMFSWFLGTPLVENHSRRISVHKCDKPRSPETQSFPKFQSSEYHYDQQVLDHSDRRASQRHATIVYCEARSPRPASHLL